MSSLLAELDVCLHIFVAHLFQGFNVSWQVTFHEVTNFDLFEFLIFQFVFGAANSGIDGLNCFTQSLFDVFVNVQKVLIRKTFQQSIELNWS